MGKRMLQVCRKLCMAVLAITIMAHAVHGAIHIHGKVEGLLIMGTIALVLLILWKVEL